MRRLSAFDHVSLDGFFVDDQGGMAWAKTGTDDPEWSEYVAGNAAGEATLLFGRLTYDLMSSYWPTAGARAQAPAVAERLNAAPKIVFSRTLQRAAWTNTTVASGPLEDGVQALKQEAGGALVLLGSGSIVSQLARAGLIDEFEVVVDPVVLGRGRTLFAGPSCELPLRRTACRAFANGKVVLRYEPGG